MIRSTIIATLFSAALAAQCHPTIRQTSTFNEGWLCSTFTYCYEVCNPAPCVLPIRKVCVKFNLGTALLDSGSIQSPAGWSGTVNAATNEVCWFADVNASSIQPNQCKTFCITTVCNPRSVEGIQTADFFSDRGVLIELGVRTAIAALGPHRNFLAGDAYATVGRQYDIQAASANDPFGQNLLLASPFALPTGMNVPGFGLLQLDPMLILVVAPIQLDVNGIGVLPLQVPPSPQLIGGHLMFQSLAFSTMSPRLSNLKPVTFR